MRNAASRVNGLPPEILYTIFEEYQKLPYTSDDAFPDHRRWTPAHVCRYWRQLALKDPHFWRRITVSKFTSQNCLEEQLRRAGSMPLMVYVRTHPLHCDDDATADWKLTLDRVLRELPRIQTLSVLHDDDDLVTYVVSALNVDTPILSELSIILECDYRHMPEDHPYVLALPNAPRLSIVELDLPRVHAIQRTPALKSSLKQLYLSQNTSPEHGNLQAALSGLPYLEDLHISVHHLRNAGVVKDVFIERPISMPRLRTIQLTGYPSDCALILNSLSIPKHCTIDINCTDGRLQDASSLGSALATKGWGNNKDGNLPSVDLMLDTELPAVFKLSAWRGAGKALNVLAEMEYHRGGLTVEMSSEHWVMDTLFHSSALLPQARRLVLGDTTPLVIRFSQMDNVEEISLKHNESQSPHVLVAVLKKRVRQVAPTLLFPKLRVIHLPSVTFETEWVPITPIPWEVDLELQHARHLERQVAKKPSKPVSISLRSLTTALQMRKKHGIPVSSLILANPIGLERRDLRSLGGIVDTVTLDGEILDMSLNRDSSD